MIVGMKSAIVDDVRAVSVDEGIETKSTPPTGRKVLDLDARVPGDGKIHWESVKVRKQITKLRNSST